MTEPLPPMPKIAAWILTNLYIEKMPNMTEGLMLKLAQGNILRDMQRENSTFFTAKISGRGGVRGQAILPIGVTSMETKFREGYRTPEGEPVIIPDRHYPGLTQEQMANTFAAQAVMLLRTETRGSNIGPDISSLESDEPLTTVNMERAGTLDFEKLKEQRMMRESYANAVFPSIEYSVPDTSAIFFDATKGRHMGLHRNEAGPGTKTVGLALPLPTPTKDTNLLAIEIHPTSLTSTQALFIRTEELAGILAKKMETITMPCSKGRRAIIYIAGGALGGMSYNDAYDIIGRMGKQTGAPAPNSKVGYKDIVFKELGLKVSRESWTRRSGDALQLPLSLDLSPSREKVTTTTANTGSHEVGFAAGQTGLVITPIFDAEDFDTGYDDHPRIVQYRMNEWVPAIIEFLRAAQVATPAKEVEMSIELDDSGSWGLMRNQNATTKEATQEDMTRATDAFSIPHGREVAMIYDGFSAYMAINNSEQIFTGLPQTNDFATFCNKKGVEPLIARAILCPTNSTSQALLDDVLELNNVPVDSGAILSMFMPLEVQVFGLVGEGGIGPFRSLAFPHAKVCRNISTSEGKAEFAEMLHDEIDTGFASRVLLRFELDMTLPMLQRETEELNIYAEQILDAAVIGFDIDGKNPKNGMVGKVLIALLNTERIKVMKGGKLRPLNTELYNPIGVVGAFTGFTPEVKRQILDHLMDYATHSDYDGYVMVNPEKANLVVRVTHKGVQTMKAQPVYRLVTEMIPFTGPSVDTEPSLLDEPEIPKWDERGALIERSDPSFERLKTGRRPGATPGVSMLLTVGDRQLPTLRSPTVTALTSKVDGFEDIFIGEKDKLASRYSKVSGKLTIKAPIEQLPIKLNPLEPMHKQVPAPFIPEKTGYSKRTVDEKMKPLLEHLWANGHKTRYSCQGGDMTPTDEFTEDTAQTIGGYIFFQGKAPLELQKLSASTGRMEQEEQQSWSYHDGTLEPEVRHHGGPDAPWSETYYWDAAPNHSNLRKVYAAFGVPFPEDIKENPYPNYTAHRQRVPWDFDQNGFGKGQAFITFNLDDPKKRNKAKHIDGWKHRYDKYDHVQAIAGKLSKTGKWAIQSIRVPRYYKLRRTLREVRLDARRAPKWYKKLHPKTKPYGKKKKNPPPGFNVLQAYDPNEWRQELDSITKAQSLLQEWFPSRSMGFADEIPYSINATIKHDDMFKPPLNAMVGEFETIRDTLLIHDTKYLHSNGEYRFGRTGGGSMGDGDYVMASSFSLPRLREFSKEGAIMTVIHEWGHTLGATNSSVRKTEVDDTHHCTNDCVMSLISYEVEAYTQQLISQGRWNKSMFCNTCIAHIESKRNSPITPYTTHFDFEPGRIYAFNELPDTLALGIRSPQTDHIHALQKYRQSEQTSADLEPEIAFLTGSTTQEDAEQHFKSIEDGGYGLPGNAEDAQYRAVLIDPLELKHIGLQDLVTKSDLEMAYKVAKMTDEEYWNLQEAFGIKEKTTDRIGSHRKWVTPELLESIKNDGLMYPSIGREGNHRNYAMALLGRKIPHLEILSPKGEVLTNPPTEAPRYLYHGSPIAGLEILEPRTDPVMEAKWKERGNEGEPPKVVFLVDEPWGAEWYALGGYQRVMKYLRDKGVELSTDLDREDYGGYFDILDSSDEKPEPGYIYKVDTKGARLMQPDRDVHNDAWISLDPLPVIEARRITEYTEENPIMPRNAIAAMDAGWTGFPWWSISPTIAQHHLKGNPPTAGTAVYIGPANHLSVAEVINAEHFVLIDSGPNHAYAGGPEVTDEGKFWFLKQLYDMAAALDYSTDYQARKLNKEGASVIRFTTPKGRTIDYYYNAAHPFAEDIPEIREALLRADSLILAGFLPHKAILDEMPNLETIFPYDQSNYPFTIQEATASERMRNTLIESLFHRSDLTYTVMSRDEDPDAFDGKAPITDQYIELGSKGTFGSYPEAVKGVRAAGAAWKIGGGPMANPLKPITADIITISGPASSGKSAIARGLKKKIGRNARIVPSVMTRKKRPKEKEGIDGIFITKKKFKEMIKRGEFTSDNGTDLWFQQENNHYYGRRATEFHHSGVTIIDVSFAGLTKMREAFPDSIYAVLIKSRMGEDKRREKLQARGTHTEEDIKRRVKKGTWQMRPENYEPLNFDFFASNRLGELDKNVAMIASEFRKKMEIVKTNPVTRCPTPDKVGHANKQSAKASAKFQMERQPGLKLWVYKCSGKYKQKNLTRTGAHWHLTSKPQKGRSQRVIPVDNPPTIYDSEGKAIQGEWWWVARHEGCKKPTKEKQKMYEWSTIPPSWWSFKHKKARPMEYITREKWFNKSEEEREEYEPYLELNRETGKKEESIIRVTYKCTGCGLKVKQEQYNDYSCMFFPKPPEENPPEDDDYPQTIFFKDLQITEELDEAMRMSADHATRINREILVIKPDLSLYFFQQLHEQLLEDGGFDNLSVQTPESYFLTIPAEDLEHNLRNKPDILEAVKAFTVASILPQTHRKRGPFHAWKPKPVDTGRPGEEERNPPAEGIEWSSKYTPWEKLPKTMIGLSAPNLHLIGKHPDGETKIEIAIKLYELGKGMVKDGDRYRKIGLDPEGSGEEVLMADSALSSMDWIKSHGFEKFAYIQGISVSHPDDYTLDDEEYGPGEGKNVHVGAGKGMGQAAYLYAAKFLSKKGFPLLSTNPSESATRVWDKLEANLPANYHLKRAGLSTAQLATARPRRLLWYDGPIENPPATMLTGSQNIPEKSWTSSQGLIYTGNGNYHRAKEPWELHKRLGKKSRAPINEPHFSELPVEARAWKKATFKSGAETEFGVWQENFQTKYRDSPYIATLKVDGEGVMAHYDGKETVIWNWYDRWRTGFHITEELTKLLKKKKVKSVKLMGELYALDRYGKMLTLSGGERDPNGMSETGASIVKTTGDKSTMERQKRMRLAIFDILELNGKDLRDLPFEERIAIAGKLVKGGKTAHLVPMRSGVGMEPMMELWKEGMEEPEFEGVVIRFNDTGKSFKVKGVATADLAIIGFYHGSITDTGSLQNAVGGVALAFMDENGDYVYAGNTGSLRVSHEERHAWINEFLYPNLLKGIKDQTKTKWGSHLVDPNNKHMANGHGAMWPVKPTKIAEVHYLRASFKESPVYRVVGDELVQVGTKRSPTLGGPPVFHRFRDDKSLTPEDLRIGQLPPEGAGKWFDNPEDELGYPGGVERQMMDSILIGSLTHMMGGPSTDKRGGRKRITMANWQLRYPGLASRLEEAKKRGFSVPSLPRLKENPATSTWSGEGVEMPEKLYHLTLQENLPSIMEKGLRPSVGPLTTMLQKQVWRHFSKGEFEDYLKRVKPKIYMALEKKDALYWKSKMPYNDDDFALIEITVPETLELTLNGMQWETAETIPPENLKVMKENPERRMDHEMYRIPKIEIYPHLYTRARAKARPDAIFLFGDNEGKTGTGGQAVIRGEPNAMGVRTKRRPTRAANAYWSDEDYHRNIKMMREDLLAAIKRVPMNGTLIISIHGIGTGLAQLPERAPKTYLWLEEVLDMLSSTDSIKSPTPMEVTA